MNKGKKICLLMVPLIFVILLFFPVMILGIAGEAHIQGMPDVMRTIFIVLLLGPALIMWTILFYYIPIGAYIAMLAVYTVVSWTWILRQKKGNVIYFIVWLVLGVLSILIYWKWWPEYYSMIWI